MAKKIIAMVLAVVTVFGVATFSAPTASVYAASNPKVNTKQDTHSTKYKNPLVIETGGFLYYKKPEDMNTTI